MSQISTTFCPYFSEESIPSDIDQIFYIEEVLQRVAQQIRLREERIPLFIVAVIEAVTNAIQHGNRHDPTKKVRVRFSAFSEEELIVEVEDEGEGFDYTVLPDPTEEANLLREGGRGIFLMRNLADSVEFLEGGRCVRLRFRQ
ncbi:MAG: ATP-binding protein [Bacteroidia bacterium]|nr:ATP-binding protein [Bacteroidia bacterium]MDW8089238.1 ATP-binding protein [Bacteroidia bacterium]